MKLQVNSIIEDIFINDTQRAIDELKRHDLYNIIEKHINILNTKPKNFNTIAGSFIEKVNSNLKRITEKKDKEYLEYLISEIGHYIIIKCIQEGIINHNDISELEGDIKTIFEINGFNYDEFQKFVPFQKMMQYHAANQTKDKTQKNPYYHWNKKDYVLDELAKNLKSEQTIYSVRDFKKLFSENPVTVKFNNRNTIFIVVLFDWLYEKKFISPKVSKGHFTALVAHSIDQDEKVLLSKNVKQINYSIKKKPAEHNKIKDKITKWLCD